MNEFLDKLNALKELASFQGNYVTREQINEAFAGLDDNQNAILEEYLKNNHIGIDKAIDSDEFLNTDDKNYLQLYLDELDELDEVNDSLKRVLLMGAINKEAAAREKLINVYLKSVVDIAKLYAGQGATIEDLIGEGNVALAVAVSMVECVETPEDADALIVKQIMNSMEEFVASESDALKNENKALDVVTKITDKARELNEDLLRKVTVEELSKESGISVSRIKDAIRISKDCLEYIEKPEDLDE